MAWLRLGSRIAGAGLREVEVNGMPGALLLDGADLAAKAEAAAFRQIPCQQAFDAHVSVPHTSSDRMRSVGPCTPTGIS